MVHAGNNLGINRLAVSRLLGHAGGGTNGRTEMNEVTRPAKGLGTVVSAVALMAALVACLVFAPLASAAETPVAAGSKTTITLNSGLSNKLKKAGVKVKSVSPATLSGKDV